MATKCLMIETKDRKRFFTLIRNKIHLKEYCRTFGAKMAVVKAEIEKTHVLDLKGLVPALCDKNYKSKKVRFNVLKNV